MSAVSHEADPSTQIFGLVSRYLADEIGFRELYAWMVEHVDWLVEAPADDASGLARLVESHLAEMSVFRSDEDALRRDVESYLSEHPRPGDHT